MVVWNSHSYCGSCLCTLLASIILSVSSHPYICSFSAFFNKIVMQCCPHICGSCIILAHALMIGIQQLVHSASSVFSTKVHEVSCSYAQKWSSKEPPQRISWLWWLFQTQRFGTRPAEERNKKWTILIFNSLWLTSYYTFLWLLQLYKLLYVLGHFPHQWYHHLNANTLIGATILFSGHSYISYATVCHNYHVGGRHSNNGVELLDAIYLCIITNNLDYSCVSAFDCDVKRFDLIHWLLICQLSHTHNYELQNCPAIIILLFFYHFCSVQMQNVLAGMEAAGGSQ